MRLSVFLTSIFLAGSATAAEFFVLPGTKTLLMMGETVPSDVQSLRNYIGQDAIDGIILKGPGGSLSAGYAIADIMLEHELDVLIPENTECASACSLIFAAGNIRRMEPGSKVGFHLPFMLLDMRSTADYCSFLKGKIVDPTISNRLITGSFGDVDDDCLERTYQLGLKDIRKLEKYLRRDGISEKLIDIVISTPSDSLTWLKPDQARTIGLVNN